MPIGVSFIAMDAQVVRARGALFASLIATVVVAFATIPVDDPPEDERRCACTTPVIDKALQLKSEAGEVERSIDHFVDAIGNAQTAVQLAEARAGLATARARLRILVLRIEENRVWRVRFETIVDELRAKDAAVNRALERAFEHGCDVVRARRELERLTREKRAIEDKLAALRAERRVQPARGRGVLD